MLPVMKNTASGDQARSYISDPKDLHMCLTLHVSLSSRPSSPNAVAGCWISAGTHKRVFPSSPAVARTSPGHDQHKTYTLPKTRTTFRSKPNNIDCLCMLHSSQSCGIGNGFGAYHLDQSGQVCNSSVITLGGDFPQSNIIITTTCC